MDKNYQHNILIEFLYLYFFLRMKKELSESYTLNIIHTYDIIKKN